MSAFLDQSIGGGAVTCYDVSGSPVNIQLRWAKIDSALYGGTDTWNLFYQVNPNATGTQTAWQNAGINYMFGANGQMNPLIGTLTLTNVTVNGIALGDVQLVHGSGGITQFADPNGNAQVNLLQQNGFPAGELQQVAVSDKGRVVGSYSNGRTLDLAEITLANFNGANYLKRIDGGAFEVTDESGPPIYGAPGKIVGSSLEGSNTDIADEFTKLIVTQQAYSANTRVISTSNQMVQDLLNMLRVSARSASSALATVNGRRRVMSLTQALATAVSGLRATQAGPRRSSPPTWRTRRRPATSARRRSRSPTAAGDLGVGVRVAAINRELDQYIQRQMRVESSGASYAGLRAQFYDRLQSVYGVPGSASSLETRLQQFHGVAAGAVDQPGFDRRRAARVLSAAQVLTQQLNSMTTDVQGLRSDAELGLADAVTRANDAMQRIAQINRQLGTANSQRRHHRHAARPARPLHRPARAADGHQRHPERPQPDHGLHQFRHPARRHRGLARSPSMRRAR